MIAAWMIYTVATTLLLYAAARSAEYIARALGAPTRFVWAIGMIAALCLSGRAFVNGRSVRNDSVAPVYTGAAPSFRTMIVIGGNRGGGGTLHESASHSLLQSLLNAAGAASHTLRGVSGRIDVAALERWNATLVALWLAASLVAAVYLLTSLVGLRRLERRFQPASVDQQSVLVSSDVGPALLGVLRSRIVLPAWVLALPRYEREIILAHEREHASAFDPALLHAAALAIVLQPWNIGLWAIFARLRLAIEADCDRRVLGVVGDARTYGQLLVTVYQRSIPARVPYVAFVRRPSNLEQRILRMTQAPRLVSIGSTAAVLAASVLATTAWVAPSPHKSPLPLQSVASLQRSGLRELKPVQITALRTDSGVETVPAGDQSRDLGLLPTKRTPPTVVSATSVAESPASVSLPGPCAAAGRLAGSAVPTFSQRFTSGCSIDGEIVVVALDSWRVLVAARDTADAGQQHVDFLVFTTADSSFPPSLRWSTTTGHAEFRDNDFYVASPAAGIPAMAFGTSAATPAASYPNALHFAISRIEILRQPPLTWDVLRQLPGAPRCKPPIFIVDGMIVSGDDDCFLIGGQPMQIP
jgi:beta-lactamase regulating signal transducer with metallopeptidase domain